VVWECGGFVLVLLWVVVGGVGGVSIFCGTVIAS